MKGFDPYKVLGISPEADLSEIRRAFREKVRRYHPDVGGEADLFLTLKRCYEELCRRHTARTSLRIVKSPPEGGSYLLTFLDLSVRELALGGAISVIVPDKPLPCPRCQGKGTDPTGQTRLCPVCKGQGSLFNEEGEELTCPRCQGVGEVPVDLCPLCRGRGELLGEKEIRVRLPQGARPEDILYLPASPEGPSMDIYFEIQLHSEGPFTFEGDKVVTRVRLPFWKVILGGKVQVQTLEGQEVLEIPPGFDPETAISLPKRGAYRADGSRGELLVRFEVFYPQDLPPEARELLERLAEILEKEEGDEFAG